MEKCIDSESSKQEVIPKVVEKQKCSWDTKLVKPLKYKEEDTALTKPDKILKPKPAYMKMDPKQYVEIYIEPILSVSLQEVARVRPDDPVSFLANYLLHEKDRCQEKGAGHHL